MFEVEQKFHVHQASELERLLAELRAVEEAIEQHSDTYYSHPCRDFAKSNEALRVRCINGSARVTYKGPKLPGQFKARRELEWSLAPGDTDGSQMRELLELLGFRPVAVVEKTRRPFVLSHSVDSQPVPSVTIDEVEKLGIFAEIEHLVDEKDQIESARCQIAELARQLGLRDQEPKSYLTMALELRNH